MEVVEKLAKALGKQAVLVGDDVRARAASQRMPTGCAAAALVRPGTPAEVALVMRLCHEARCAVVPRGGMTGLVGGTVTGSNEIALSLERLTRIEETDVVSRTMTVEAGVVLQRIQECAAKHSLSFPLDFGARGTATIGGAISTNAGGNKVLRYGMTRDMVLGVEAVLADGRIVSSMFKIHKNNTGFDLKHLFIGTEGTLGVVTRAILRLRDGVQWWRTALVALADFSAVTNLLTMMHERSGEHLSAFEMMYQEYYCLLTEAGRHRAPLSQSYPLYVLLEWEGTKDDGLESRFEPCLQNALELGWITDAVIAKSHSERGALWAIRDDVHYLRTLDPLFSFDVSVPIPQMARYVSELRSALANRWKTSILVCYGHVADGNLHLAISCEGGEAARNEVAELVYQPLRLFRGSVSAEHGIGLYKKQYLHLTRTPIEREAMRALKRALDCHNILNPGKIMNLCDDTASQH